MLRVTEFSIFNKTSQLAQNAKDISPIQNEFLFLNTFDKFPLARQTRLFYIPLFYSHYTLPQYITIFAFLFYYIIRIILEPVRVNIELRQTINPYHYKHRVLVLWAR